MKKFFLLSVTIGSLLSLLPWASRADTIQVTTTLPVIADTYVGQYYPTNNYGTDDLNVGLHLGASGYDAISFLKFDLSAIPDNATIIEITLNLIIYSNFSPPTELYVNRWLDNSWNEYSLTYNLVMDNWWSNLDGGLAHPTLTNNSGGCSILFDFNRYAMIEDEVLPDNLLSIIIWDQTFPFAEQIQFLSKETANPDFENEVPRLTITYQYEVVPLPGAVWLLGSGLLSLGAWRRFKKG